MKLPDAQKRFGDGLVGLLARLRIRTTREKLGWTTRRVVWVLGLAGAVALVMIPGLFVSQYPVNPSLVGSFATANYKADRDYVIPDAETTQRLRDEADAAVVPVFDLDVRVGDEQAEKIQRAFEHLNQVALRGEGARVDAGTEPAAAGDAGAARIADEVVSDRFIERLQAERDTFERLLQIPIGSGTYDTLIGASLDKALGPTTARAVKAVLDTGVVSDRALLLAEGLERITVRPVPAEAQPERVETVREMVDLAASQAAVERALEADLVDRTQVVREAATSIAAAAIKPTLVLNRALTEQRRGVAAASVKPVMVNVRRGEMILRDGEQIRPRHLTIFIGIHEAQRSRHLLALGLGLALIVALLVVTVVLFTRRTLRALKIEEKDLLTLSILLFVTVAMVRGWSTVAPALQERFAGISIDAFRELVPIAFGPMLVGFLLSPELALAFCVVVALLSGLAMENSIPFAVYAFTGGVVAAAGVSRVRQRTTLLKAGLFTGLVHAAAGVFLMMSSGGGVTSVNVLAHVVFGLSSGLLAAVLVAGLVPVIEVVFGYVSDIKLLELANLNHPLLKELIVQAPGTYHHSIIIGSLVEAGAESIHANPLLARVMAYYHDVGKIKNPRYFAENQRDGNNPHDKLAPSMSALILRSHVKDGLELARAHKIPALVYQAINEHHGANLMSFFYSKAKEAEDAEVQTVKELDYRYSGKRPSTRESALVMIADAVEAASRSVSEPTSERLMGLVQKTINRLFSDGALSVSDLTLRDLHEIAKAFHRVLLGIYHERPAYQTAATKERRDTKETAREKRGDGKSSSASTTTGEHKRAGEGGKGSRRRAETNGGEGGRGKRRGDPDATEPGRQSRRRQHELEGGGADARAKGKEATRGEGEGAGDGAKASGGGDRGKREESPKEDLKRLGSER